jgi:hypothetical protein
MTSVDPILGGQEKSPKTGKIPLPFGTTYSKCLKQQLNKNAYCVNISAISQWLGQEENQFSRDGIGTRGERILFPSL